ncbi:MAG: kinase-like domain-containing protein, partial [Olpidium bornovanus]
PPLARVFSRRAPACPAWPVGPAGVHARRRRRAAAAVVPPPPPPPDVPRLRRRARFAPLPSLPLLSSPPVSRSMPVTPAPPPAAAAAGAGAAVRRLDRGGGSSSGSGEFSESGSDTACSDAEQDGLRLARALAGTCVLEPNDDSVAFSAGARRKTRKNRRSAAEVRRLRNSYFGALVDELISPGSLVPGLHDAHLGPPEQYVYTAPCERRPAEDRPDYVVNEKFPEYRRDVSKIAFGIRISDFLPVAFKTVSNRSLFETELAFLRYLGACRLTARCPHIVRLTDTFTDDNGEPVLVFRKLDQLAWADLDLITIARQAKELMTALRAIHSVGIAHLDVNPSNMMMDNKGRLVLIDFGLARECIKESPWACTDPCVGTPANFAEACIQSPGCYELSAAASRLLNSYAERQSIRKRPDNLANVGGDCRQAARPSSDWRASGDVSPVETVPMSDDAESAPGEKWVTGVTEGDEATIYSRSAPTASTSNTVATDLADVASTGPAGRGHRLAPHPLRGTPGFIAPELYAAGCSPPVSPGFWDASTVNLPPPTGAPDVYSAGVVIGAAAALYIPGCDLHLLGGALTRGETTNRIVRKLHEFARDPLSWQRHPPVVIELADMLRGMLEEDPARRMTADEVLRSPFLMALEDGSPSAERAPGSAAAASGAARHFEGTGRAAYEKRLRELEWARYEAEFSAAAAFSVSADYGWSISPASPRYATATAAAHVRQETGSGRFCCSSYTFAASSRSCSRGNSRAAAAAAASPAALATGSAAYQYPDLCYVGDARAGGASGSSYSGVWYYSDREECEHLRC